MLGSVSDLIFGAKFQVEVEALVIQGPKLETVLSQVKKLEASVLVVPQKKPSLFGWWVPTLPSSYIEAFFSTKEKTVKSLNGYDY